MKRGRLRMYPRKRLIGFLPSSMVKQRLSRNWKRSNPSGTPLFQAKPTSDANSRYMYDIMGVCIPLRSHEKPFSMCQLPFGEYVRQLDR